MNIEPRYVHGQDVRLNKKSSGFTIAYHREPTYIVFSVALQSKNDAYVKSIGRKIASERLLANSDLVPTSHTNYADDIMTGCVTLPHMHSTDSVTFILADSVVVDLTMMAFKHAYISSVLYDFVCAQYETY